MAHRPFTNKCCCCKDRSSSCYVKPNSGKGGENTHQQTPNHFTSSAGRGSESKNHQCNKMSGLKFNKKKRVAFANSCYMKSEQKQERSIRHLFAWLVLLLNYNETACSLGLSATSQQYFSLRTNQPLATSQQYSSLRQTSTSHQPPANRTGSLLLLLGFQSCCCPTTELSNSNCVV
jgi:hypothetical protein